MPEENNALKETHQETITNTENVADAIGTFGASSSSSNIGAIRKSADGQQKFSASTKTDSSEAEYNMNHKFRGFALIFNHEHFNVPFKRLDVREGTNVDRDKLKKCLEMLHFDVSTHDDYSFSKIKDTIAKVANLDHSDNDCILIAILSHGEKGYIYSKDKPYLFETIWNPFTVEKCPSLAGKPKLFFIQACKGKARDLGVTMKRATETDGQSMNYRFPTHADFLFAYSTIPDFVSYRNPKTGSRYIQALCEELETNGKKLYILKMLTNVARRVAIGKKANKEYIQTYKQIPCFSSMLIRKLRFNDKA